MIKKLTREEEQYIKDNKKYLRVSLREWLEKQTIKLVRTDKNDYRYEAEFPNTLLINGENLDTTSMRINARYGKMFIQILSNLHDYFDSMTDKDIKKMFKGDK